MLNAGSVGVAPTAPQIEECVGECTFSSGDTECTP